MDQGSQDRNLPASERKLKKARDDGQVSRSEDLSHLAVLGAGAIAVVVLLPGVVEHLKLDMIRQLSFDADIVKQTDAMVHRLGESTSIGLLASLTFAAIVLSAAVAAAVFSGGWVQSLKPLMPDLSRLNPLSGIANMFAKKKLVNTAKMMMLISIIASVGGVFLVQGFEPVASLVMQPSQSALAALAQWIAGGVGLMLLVLLVAAMIDVPLQSFLHKSEMKMSRQEFKEEGKEADGNPHMRSSMRRKQRELSQRNSVKAVPKADFVVMNPTHFAVAIRYDDKTMRAPQVISKGADLLAMRIRDIAKTHSIPVLQSPMLARALYANAELDEDIPSALYTAVAQVLAYVYRLRAAMRGEGPMPGEVPQPDVPRELDPQIKILQAAAA